MEALVEHGSVGLACMWRNHGRRTLHHCAKADGRVNTIAQHVGDHRPESAEVVAEKAVDVDVEESSVEIEEYACQHGVPTF